MIELLDISAASVVKPRATTGRRDSGPLLFVVI